MDMEVDWIGGGQNSSFGKGKKNKRNGTMAIVCIMRFGGRAKRSKKSVETLAPLLLGIDMR
jgi:hypothetical protein